MGGGQRDQPGRAVHLVTVVSGAVSADDNAGAAPLHQISTTISLRSVEAA